MSARVHSTDATLVIRHIPESAPASFQLVRPSDAKTTEPASAPSPHGFPVEGRPNSDLMQELQWYLETFLDYPFPPETDRADRVLKALKDWGEKTFLALFGDRSAGRMFEAATADDYSGLHLQISSDDARVLAWPWEALRDPEAGVLAHTCQIERRLNKVHDPQPLPPSLPDDQVNILLVVARPYGDRDVGFRSIARPMVELIEKEKLPAHVELLRPPTFDRLREHLRQRPGFYHIVHFDGHGAYTTEAPGTGGYTFQGPEGKLVFETEEGKPDPITAEKLSALLKEHAVPGVVLNACQSAMVDGDTDDPFSSVAAALLRSGMRSVVAMAYSLYVSGAQQFLPAFYRRLFEEGNMAGAVRAGRQQMFRQDKRVCVRGKFPLQDWLLPVLYQQDPLSFSFAAEARRNFVPEPSKLPEELQREKNPYGFVGRDSAILAMERAMRRAPAGMLIQGLGGIGKTTLARGFLQWLDATGGLGEGCFWLGFQEIRSAEYVFNRLGEALFSGQFAMAPMDKKIEALAAAFNKRPFIIVWDNFESAAGISGTAVSANLPESDRKLLADFLDKLRGGASKVIMTSRASEDWLGPQRRFLLPLGGLDREERWEYCEAILRDLGITIDRDDEKLIELMNLLGGHPLAMRAILPRLEKLSAGQVAEALRSNLANLRMDGDENLAKLYATLGFVEQSLPTELQPLLIPVAMHEGHLDGNYLQAMAQQVDPAWTRPMIDALIQGLVSAGLLREIGQATHEMHPMLTGYLRSKILIETPQPLRDSWAKAFAGVMGNVANSLAPLRLDQQRIPFHLHGQNFHYALGEAERLSMETGTAALMQSLAVFAENTRNLAQAARLFERLASRCNSSGNKIGEAAAFHQLGWVAEEQRDFVAAEQWYLKSLTLTEKQVDERVASSTYHQLGMLAQKRRDFATAEQWYHKSLGIKKKQGDEPGVASSYHQLATIAEEQRNFVVAEQMCHKSLAISERLKIEEYASGTYYVLGQIAQERRDLVAAEQWCHKSLAIREKQGDEGGIAGTYQQLGSIAQEQGNFASAERWYYKSLAINEKQGNEHGAARIYAQLGLLSAIKGDLLEGGRWMIKSLLGFLGARDSDLANLVVSKFLVIYSNAPLGDQSKLKATWEEAGLGEFPSQAA
jgi:tetratricopeptide (TPR) repeat protein